MSATTLQRAEAVRLAVLEYLAPRQSLKYDLPLLLDRLNKSRIVDFTIEADDLSGAVAFLLGRGFLEETFSALGATRFYQATSAGVLAFERGTFEDK